MDEQEFYEKLKQLPYMTLDKAAPLMAHLEAMRHEDRVQQLLFLIEENSIFKATLIALITLKSDSYGCEVRLGQEIIRNEQS